jgi:hypothetical protein
MNLEILNWAVPKSIDPRDWGKREVDSQVEDVIRIYPGAVLMVLFIVS